MTSWCTVNAWVFVCCRTCLVTNRVVLGQRQRARPLLGLELACLETNPHWHLVPTLVLPTLVSHWDMGLHLCVCGGVLISGTNIPFVSIHQGFGANPAGGSLFGNKTVASGLGTGLGAGFGAGLWLMFIILKLLVSTCVLSIDCGTISMCSTVMHYYKKRCTGMLDRNMLTVWLNFCARVWTSALTCCRTAHDSSSWGQIDNKALMNISPETVWNTECLIKHIPDQQPIVFLIISYRFTAGIFCPCFEVDMEDFLTVVDKNCTVTILVTCPAAKYSVVKHLSIPLQPLYN